MDISEQRPQGNSTISKANWDEVIVGDSHLKESFYMGYDYAPTPWKTSGNLLEQSDLEQLPIEQHELVLIGTGREMKQLAPDIRSQLAETTTFEVMSTISACRTFNIVVGEGRKVLLAVIIEP
jgi:uncharacterized protein